GNRIANCKLSICNLQFAIFFLPWHDPGYACLSAARSPVVHPLKEQWFIGLNDLDQVGRIAVRLSVAVLLGAALGYEREREGKAAGLRTHMLVSLGAALFMTVAIEAEVPVNDLSRVIQGLAVGIGFLGAGAILKLSQERKIEGLTTAANIWVAAAVGLSAGMG